MPRPDWLFHLCCDVSECGPLVNSVDCDCHCCTARARCQLVWGATYCRVIGWDGLMVAGYVTLGRTGDDYFYPGKKKKKKKNKP